MNTQSFKASPALQSNRLFLSRASCIRPLLTSQRSSNTNLLSLNRGTPQFSSTPCSLLPRLRHLSQKENINQSSAPSLTWHPNKRTATLASDTINTSNSKWRALVESTHSASLHEMPSRRQREMVLLKTAFYVLFGNAQHARKLRETKREASISAGPSAEYFSPVFGSTNKGL